MAKAIEKTGIPVALITALTTLAEDVGAPRIVQGVRIPHPCGNPTLPPDRDQEMRKRILLTALKALQTAVQESTIFTDPSVLM
jgi:glycine reductase